MVVPPVTQSAYTPPVRRFSRERIAQLASDLVSMMGRLASVKLLKDRDAVLQAIGASLSDEFRREEEREENVRRRMVSMVRPPARGTREYDEVFSRLLEEEYLREGLDS